MITVNESHFLDIKVTDKVITLLRDSILLCEIIITLWFSFLLLHVCVHIQWLTILSGIVVYGDTWMVVYDICGQKFSPKLNITIAMGSFYR